jgi:hypothetical protein
MNNDQDSQFTDQDHDDLCAWIDEQEVETRRLLDQVCEGVELMPTRRAHGDLGRWRKSNLV